MQFLKEEALSGSLVPVLVGASKQALQSARSFYLQYGVLSHLFGDRIPLFYHLLPFVKAHKVRATKDDALLLQALLDFAKQLDGADRVLCLFPCTKSYLRFVSIHKAELEGAFVLSSVPSPYREEGVT